MKPPAFQFYADDFIGGTVDLSPEDVGCYIRLLCYQWGRGEIPATKAACDRIAGGIVSAEVMAKFPNRKNVRMERERVKQSEYKAAQAKNGAEGARRRWHGTANGDAIATPSPENGGATVSPMANSMAKNASPSPSPSPISDSVAASGSDAERREINRHLPESLNTGPFREAWAKWVTYWPTTRSGGTGIIPQATADNHLQLLLKLGPIDAVAAIENAISKGFREPALPNSGGSQGGAGKPRRASFA